MNKRECSDCRENEKTFRNNMSYKCQNEYCENYVEPMDLKKQLTTLDFHKDLINQLNNKLYETQTENFKLKREINRLIKKLNMCDLTF